MCKIIIDKDDFNFLIESKMNVSLIETISKSAIIKFGNVELDISRKNVESILDYVANELSANGFDGNDEPNTYGLRLEFLIDKLSNVFYN